MKNWIGKNKETDAEFVNWTLKSGSINNKKRILMASNLRVDSIVPTTSGNVSIGTATGGVTIPGDLGVAGTLTYEDVTI